MPLDVDYPARQRATDEIIPGPNQNLSTAGFGWQSSHVELFDLTHVGCGGTLVPEASSALREPGFDAGGE
jgi:hypothetical protein